MREPNEAFPNYCDDARRFIRNYCWACPVIRECGEWADRFDVEHGIWGGVCRRRIYETEELW